MAKDMREFINKCNVCSKMSPFINFRPFKPIKVNYPFKLVSLDTAHAKPYMCTGIECFFAKFNIVY